MIAGCGEQGEYRIRLGTPWLDEYAFGKAARIPETTLLAPPTVAWHVRMDPHELTEQVLQRAAGRPHVYAFARRGLADRAGGTGPERMWFVEARLGFAYFPRSACEPFDGTLEGSLREVVNALGRPSGMRIEFDAAVDADSQLRREVHGLDPREAIVRLLADRGLFAREWEFQPLTLRSFEYASASSFLETVAAVADAVEKRGGDNQVTIVPFEAWHRRARAAQRELLAGLEKSLKGRRRFGKFLTTVPLPTPTLLSENPDVARRQAVFAASAQIASPVEAMR